MRQNANREINADMCSLMQDQAWLTTEEAASYLRLKERKLYELVGQGAVPCTKVSGKAATMPASSIVDVVASLPRTSLKQQ